MPYRTFHLATHVNAALAGYDIKLGMLPEFAGETEWVFLVPGPNGFKLRLVPDDWVATMRLRGDRRAWLGYVPEPMLWGGGIWTEGNTGLCFYHASDTKVAEDGHSRTTLTGYLQEASPYPLDGAIIAMARLSAAFPPMIALAHELKNGFASRLEEAQAILTGELDTPSRYLDAFPLGLYPPTHVRLLAAGIQGDVFGNGGMGWWRDGLPDDATAQAVTRAYADALSPAFPAASRLDLS